MRGERFALSGRSYFDGETMGVGAGRCARLTGIIIKQLRALSDHDIILPVTHMGTKR